jgi:hypothetical protein
MASKSADGGRELTNTTTHKKACVATGGGCHSLRAVVRLCTGLCTP